MAESYAASLMLVDKVSSMVKGQIMNRLPSNVTYSIRIFLISIMNSDIFIIPLHISLSSSMSPHNSLYALLYLSFPPSSSYEGNILSMMKHHSSPWSFHSRVPYRHCLRQWPQVPHNSGKLVLCWKIRLEALLVRHLSSSNLPGSLQQLATPRSLKYCINVAIATWNSSHDPVSC